jgi:hypothetical protein
MSLARSILYAINLLIIYFIWNIVVYDQANYRSDFYLYFTAIMVTTIQSISIIILNRLDRLFISLKERQLHVRHIFLLSLPVGLSLIIINLCKLTDDQLSYLNRSYEICLGLRWNHGYTGLGLILITGFLCRAESRNLANALFNDESIIA